ncbi:MAG: hypothetical protein ABL867_11610 [Rickettsiales bacterium]
MDWYGYTGESLVAGRGRMIQNVVAGNSAIADFIVAAGESYKIYSRFLRGVSKETYNAAFIAALAIRELDKNPKPENFTSLKQIYKLFAGLDIEQVAINFLNARIVSTYQTENLGKQLVQGFAKGELLFLPRDQASLYSPEYLNKLPGIIVFLLTKSNSERKAFNDYLRRGIPPIFDSNAYTKIANTRPVLASFAKEIREEKALQQRGCL